ncbi:MAG: hypothetical protein ACP5NZ_03320 [Nanobdellota archaeon]
MKTRDGIKLEKIVEVAKQLGMVIKEGTKHPYLLIAEGMIPCPVAASTDARRMVVPWMRRVTGYDSGTLYSYLKRGEAKPFGEYSIWKTLGVFGSIESEGGKEK